MALMIKTIGPWSNTAAIPYAPCAKPPLKKNSPRFHIKMNENLALRLDAIFEKHTYQT